MFKFLRQFFCQHKWNVIYVFCIKAELTKLSLGVIKDSSLIIIEKCRKCGKEKSFLIESNCSKRCNVDWAKENLKNSKYNIFPKEGTIKEKIE